MARSHRQDEADLGVLRREFEEQAARERERAERSPWVYLLFALYLIGVWTVIAAVAWYLT